MGFFQKNFTRGLPADVPRVSIAAESTERTVHYVIGGSEKTLLSLVNLGCIASRDEQPRQVARAS